MSEEFESYPAPSRILHVSSIAVMVVAVAATLAAFALWFVAAALWDQRVAAIGGVAAGLAVAAFIAYLSLVELAE